MNRILPLAICGTSFLLYIVILSFYMIRIRKQKKALPQGTVIPKTTASFKAIFITALLLLLLPILIPLDSYLIAVVCACGILGEFLALKDRLEQLKA